MNVWPIQKVIMKPGFEFSNGIFSGNQGLKDQRTVLQWIRRNVRNFGGDPDQVALFGQSSGAADILLHMALPESQHLFNRVILQVNTLTSTCLLCLDKALGWPCQSINTSFNELSHRL